MHLVFSSIISLTFATYSRGLDLFYLQVSSFEDRTTLNAVEVEGEVIENKSSWASDAQESNCTRVIQKSRIIPLSTIWWPTSSQSIPYRQSCLLSAPILICIIFIFLDIAGFIGVLLFTLQYTICISSCPPMFTYYPISPGKVSFGWSFMVAWIGIACLIGNTALLFVYSCLVEARYAKVSDATPPQQQQLLRCFLA